MSISIIERGILYNQFEILKKLYPEEKSYYEKSQKIIEYGTELEITELWAFGDKITSQELSSTVYSILELYWKLNLSYKNLEDKSDISESDINFKGFDGNEESEYYTYVKYLVNDLGKYSELKDKDLNSHCPMLPRYRSMLSRYQKIKEKNAKFIHRLTVEEIKYIIE